MYIKLIKNTIITIVILIAINYIYTRHFYEKDIQKYSHIVNLVREVPADADIIYIGESSNNTKRGDDIDTRKISDFVGDYFPSLNTYDITKPASHAGIYKVLLENIPDTNQVETVIVTLNLRSFNAQWIYSELETALQKSILLIQDAPPLFNRFMLSFKGYDIKTSDERTKQFKQKWKNDEFRDLPFEFEHKNVAEWDKWMATHGVKNKDGQYDYPKTELACHYIKAYGFQLDTINNPRIKDFDDIISLAQERGWRLVMNLLPENTEKADELVGDHLIYMMNSNASLLEKYFNNKGITVVNNLNLVEDEQFIDQHWTTEHYAEKGRKAIARNVATTIKKWYQNDYEKIIYNHHKKTYDFLNDCEGGSNWQPLSSLSSDVAYSGNKSSKTGSGSDYSISFEYPLNQIAYNSKDSISVRFWFYPTKINPEIKLVIQTSGKQSNNYWNGYPILSTPSISTNTWNQFEQKIEIPKEIRQSENLKIYLYNPTHDLVYIDDLRIKIN